MQARWPATGWQVPCDFQSRPQTKAIAPFTEPFTPTVSVNSDVSQSRTNSNTVLLQVGARSSLIHFNWVARDVAVDGQTAHVVHLFSTTSPKKTLAWKAQSLLNVGPHILVDGALKDTGHSEGLGPFSVW